MVKVSVKNHKYKEAFYIVIIGIIIFTVIFKLDLFGLKKGRDDSNSINKSILYKEEHLLTFDEWKKIADIYTSEYYECMKVLDMDYTKDYLSSACGNKYRNQYVKYRDGLDTRANLKYNQISELLDYWDKISDATRKRAIKAMEENDKRKRPNKDN
jgi:hypothetical protein